MKIIGSSTEIFLGKEKTKNQTLRRYQFARRSIYEWRHKFQICEIATCPARLA